MKKWQLSSHHPIKQVQETESFSVNSSNSSVVVAKSLVSIQINHVFGQEHVLRWRIFASPRLEDEVEAALSSSKEEVGNEWSSNSTSLGT